MLTATRPAGRQTARALANLTWTLVVVIGGPIALAVFFGWPLPGQMPDWGEAISTPVQLIDPVVILNTFVCLAWICWAIVVSYVALDVVDAARGIGQRGHRIGPLSTVAAKLVGSALIIIAVARPHPAASSAPRPLPVVQLSEVHLNPVHVPVSASTAIDLTPTPGAPAPAPSPTYTVVRGDNLWDIAEAHLGSGFRWSEIHDLNRDLIHDPNLICIGWQLTLPADAVGLAPVEAPPIVPAETLPVMEVPAVAATPAPAPPPTTDAPLSGPDQPVVASAPVAPPPTGAAPDLASTTAAVDAEDELPSLVEVVAGITGATVLATNLLLVLRRRQRRATTEPRRRARVSETERTVIASSDVPLVRWAGQELALLGEQLAGRSTPANPVAVEVSEDYGLELLWDRPYPNAPAPWEAVPGAWAWRLLYDPDQPVPDPQRPALIAGLVSIGERDGRQLLVDLEGLGLLSITGDDDAVTNFVRAVVVELGSGDDLSDAYVALTPDIAAMLSTDDLPRLQTVDIDEAHARIVSAAVSTADQIADSRSTSTFGHRIAAVPVLPLDVVVTVTNADHTPTLDLTDHDLVRRAVSVLAIGEIADADSHLRIAADGTARLEPLGVEFRAAALPLETDLVIAELLEPDIELDDAADLATELAAATEVDETPLSALDDDFSDPVSPNDEVVDLRTPEERVAVDLVEQALLDHTVTTDEPVPGDDADRPSVDESRQLMIRVLGEPTVIDGPHLGRREMIVVACTACLDRPARQEDIQDAIWGGKPVQPRTIWNLITRARAQLGRWGDEPILSNAVRPHQTFHLADGVTTDFAQLQDLHRQAQGAPPERAAVLLRQALDLVTGPPFDADGYDWARVHQFVNTAERLIESCATTLVDLAIETGDLDLGRFAVLQGLRGLPGDESLYRARMRIEDVAGNTTAVRAAYDELVCYLDDLEASPSHDTAEMYQHLVGRR